MVVVTHEMGFMRDTTTSSLWDGGLIIEENELHEFFNSPKEERTKQSFHGFYPDATPTVEYMI